MPALTSCLLLSSKFTQKHNGANFIWTHRFPSHERFFHRDVLLERRLNERFFPSEILTPTLRNIQTLFICYLIKI